jgi:hydroxymethylbilane synthase
LFKREYILEGTKRIKEVSHHCFWISRSSALPIDAQINSTNIIWTSGVKTWKSLAERGVWVNGTADGMGENSNQNIDDLTSNPWIKLTHKSAPKTKIKDVIHTYFLKELPIDKRIVDKKFFYWMSYSAFSYVLKLYPEIIDGYHACGPGNTYEALKKVIKDPKRLEIVLSYNSWKKKLV